MNIFGPELPPNEPVWKWSERCPDCQKFREELEALERGVTLLRKIAEQDCENPQGHDEEIVSHEMAIDAGDLSLEGSQYRPAEWQECGGCFPCRAKQEVTALDKLRGKGL